MPEQSRSPSTGAEGVGISQEIPKVMLLWAMGLLIAASLLVLLHSVRIFDGLESATFGLLLALSALVIGALVGFLFGIPRALQQSDNFTRSDASGNYAVNTNLEQISDWLTKILVGVGLVELSQVPQGFTQLSNTLAPGLGGATSSPLIAGVVMTLFGTCGFLLGYLLTRTVLTTTLNHFDGTLAKNLSSAVQKTETTLSGSAKDPAPYASDLRPPPGAEIPATHNREPLGDPLPLPGDSAPDDLVELCDQAAILLRQLVGTVGPERVATPAEMVRVLVRRGVLDNFAATALDKLFELSDGLKAGEALPEPVASTVRKSGSAVLRELSSLGGTAAARFEEHVLDTLHNELPKNWKMLDDVELNLGRGPESGADRKNSDESLDSPRVDAVVTHNDVSVAVEVRTSLGDEQLAWLESLLGALPENIPLLLVIPNGRSRNRRLRRVIESSAHRVKVLSWDDEADQFISTIQKLQQI